MLKSKGHADVRISINLSGDELRQSHFIEKFQRILDNANVSGDMLALEITENALTPQIDFDLETIINTLSRIRKLGTTVSVDNFGTGFSSLQYLRHFPLDEIKIDRSFVSDVARDPKAVAVVNSIISLGHNLGLRVIAEGVETQDQLEFLRGAKCDQAQGFFYAKPMPFEHVPATLSQLEQDWNVLTEMATAEVNVLQSTVNEPIKES